ncbi:hypothetical protein PMAYCL1PPCAC_26851, partial [Pristionchus mayeri]
QMSSSHVFLIVLLVLATSSEGYSRFGAGAAQPRGHVVKREAVNGDESAAGSYSGRFRSGGQDVLTRYLGFV